MAKKTLDRSRPYGRLASADINEKPPGAFTQDGLYFDGEGVECGKTEGYERLQEQAKAAEKRVVEDKQADDETIKRATEFLGDLDIAAEAQRENAAAAEAEKLADDAA